MALFLDRHDMPGATTAEIAAAHAQDMLVSPTHDVQFLSYWFDAETGMTFCLARAPHPGAMEAVHREAHGHVASQIMAVSEDSLLRFMGAIQDPAETGSATSPFRTILFTDLVGSTALLQDLGDAGFMVLLTEHDLIIRRALLASHGREVKHTGDGIMAAFDDVARALECAAAIEDGFDARAAGGNQPELSVRVGLAAGEPVDRGNDLFGTTVHLASRICEAADPGQILTSDLVRDHGIEQGFILEAARERLLKGFARPIPVFELRRAGRSSREPGAGA